MGVSKDETSVAPPASAEGTGTDCLIHGPSADAAVSGVPPRSGMARLAVGAVGVVFGDIGTSPIYALKESFIGHHRLPVDVLHLYGVVSLIFWTMMIVVTAKYVMVMLRADNHGEGGSFALLALITRLTGEKRWTAGLIMLGVFATSLFYGDSIITPAISVLSAVEGIKIVDPAFAPWVVPLAVAILIGLFAIQRRGTKLMDQLFGPIMILYFVAIAALGLAAILRRPAVLMALSPTWIAAFVMDNPVKSFFALGSVVLAVTGAEALYADMGQFGRRPIGVAWLYLVFPCLILNYLGQCAMLLRDPTTVKSPFFELAPDMLRLPLVALATLATIIASQAVISGAFSVTRQAIQLGFMPRMRIEHTSASAEGQIYLPAINWMLLAMVLILVVTFGASARLAGAYGIAVTGTMLITTVMLVVLMLRVWHVKYWLAVPVLVLFLVVDLLYFSSNLFKLLYGGWVPLAMGVAIFTLLTTWARGRHLMRANMTEGALPIGIFAKSANSSAQRVPGTAIFLASASEGVPSALLHNIKHNKVLHERVVLLTVAIQDIPYVMQAKRFTVTPIGQGFYRLVINYGFLENSDVPATLCGTSACGEPFDMMRTSFFLSRQTLIASGKPGMALWREKLFAWMLRNATSAMAFFRLPVNRVVELGSQVEI